MGTEKIIEQDIRKRLKDLDFLTYKIHVGQYGPEGFPDLLVVKNRITSYLEVKAPDKNPTLIQRFRMRELRQAGCVAEPVWSFKDTMRILRKGGVDV